MSITFLQFAGLKQLFDKSKWTIFILFYIVSKINYTFYPILFLPKKLFRYLYDNIIIYNHSNIHIEIKNL